MNHELVFTPDGKQLMTANVRAQKPEVGFVDEGGGLKRLSGTFVRHLLHRQFAQLVVDQGQQLAGSLRIALLDGAQDSGDVVHARPNRFKAPRPKHRFSYNHAHRNARLLGCKAGKGEHEW